VDRLTPQDERDLGGVLRAEAERHQPDRTAMLERIDRGRHVTRGPVARIADLWRRPAALLPRPVALLLRPAGAAAAVAAVLVAGVSGVQLANRSAEPDRPAVAPSPSATPSPSAATSLGPAITVTSPTPRKTGRPSVSSSPPAVRDGYLTATGVRDPNSIATWSQSNLTLATTETITALDVTVRIARTAGVADTGHWTSIPADLVTTGVTVEDREVVYRYTLKPGAKLSPGTYAFGVQYNHASGKRSPAGDSYAATSTAGRQARVTGGFTG
jgi:hypothetical protein